MRTAAEARKEFNRSMTGYEAIIVATEHEPFDTYFFIRNRMIQPSGRHSYVPPPCVGAEYFPEFFKTMGRGRIPQRWRDEQVPNVRPDGRYLICDDYANTGETFEIAMVRLIEKGISIDNIWCTTQKGCKDQNGAVLLATGREWHDYRQVNDAWQRALLKEFGHEFPSLEGLI